MEVLAKGQLSYMILSCLSERDMYGLELIDEIKNKYGREVKLPSLYSNLNRMKELKYISSYLKESSKGPKCSYSSITEAGRRALDGLKEDFRGLNVVKPVEKKEEHLNDLNDTNFSLDQNEGVNYNQHTPLFGENIEIEENHQIDINEKTDQEDDYDEYFDLSIEENEPKKAKEQENILAQFNGNNEQNEEKLDDDIYSENYIEEPEIKSEENSFRLNEEQNEIKNHLKEQEKSNLEEKETEKKSVEDYNQKVYEAAKDFSRNKYKRSYAENQIELALSTSPSRSQESQQQNLTELKTALLQTRQGHYEDFNNSTFDNNLIKNKDIQSYNENESEEKQEIKDDGVFITERIAEENIPKPKKIEPARLNIVLNNNDKKLPAPRRNVSVDPTCNDVKAKLEKLYAKAELKKDNEVIKEDFESYEELKNYYATQDVEFKIYEKQDKKIKHNTNLLKFYVSLFIFGLIGIGSGVMYLIFSLCGLTSVETNFVYYLFPIISFVYVVYSFYNYKTSTSKIPEKMWHPAVVWTILALLIMIIFLINYACGVPFNELNSYFSTILVPIFAVVCETVGLYYTQIYTYKKFWK